jgi:hypothetical protein
MSNTKKYTESCIWFSGDATSIIVDSTAELSSEKSSIISVKPDYAYVLSIESNKMVLGCGESIKPPYGKDDTTKVSETVSTSAKTKSISITTSDALEMSP